MAWLSRVNFVSSDTLSFTDINNLGNDIRAWGDNVNGGGYTLSNVVLSASSGTMATVTGGTGAASTLTIRSTSGTGTSDAIVFQTASQSERMRITTGGNVGIGTASPAYQTQVSGSGQTTAALTDSGSKGGSVFIADTGAAPGNGGALLFAGQVQNGAIPGCAIKSLLTNGTANGASDLAFSTRNATSDTALTERMRITSSGAVGINLVPTTSPLEVGGEMAAVSGFAALRLMQTVTGTGYRWTLNNNSTLTLQYTTNAFSTAANRLFVDASGNFMVGGNAARATTAGTNQVVIFDGVAPVGTLANGCSFYSTAGEMRVMDAAGNATLLSPHDSATNEWIYDSSHTPSGKRLKINVERLLRFINDHFGLDCVHDLMEEA